MERVVLPELPSLKTTQIDLQFVASRGKCKMLRLKAIKAVLSRVNFTFFRPEHRSDHVILPTDLVVHPLLSTIPTVCQAYTSSSG